MDDHPSSTHNPRHDAGLRREKTLSLKPTTLVLHPLFSWPFSQELNEWDTALGFYEKVLQASRRINGFGGSESEEAVVVEAQIRRCDLLHAQEHLLEARACWEVSRLCLTPFSLCWR